MARPRGDPPARALTRRQVLLAATLTLPATAATALPAQAAPLPPGARAHTRWDRRPDGPMPPRGDEGLPFDVVAQHGTPPKVAGGALVAELPARPGATYVMQSLPPRVTRVGAVYGFGAGSEHGALGLITWVAGADLTSPCHVVLTRGRWMAGTVRAGVLAEFASGSVGGSGDPAARRRAEVVVEGRALVLHLPDGSVRRVSEDAVAGGPASVACWEFYRQRADGAPVLLYETWAD